MYKGEYNSLDIQTGFKKKTLTFLVIFLPFYFVYCILACSQTLQFLHHVYEDKNCKEMTDHPQPQLAFAIGNEPFHGFFIVLIRSIQVCGKLPTYPSPKLTLTLTSHLGQNDGLGEGQVGSFPEPKLILLIKTTQQKSINTAGNSALKLGNLLSLKVIHPE